MAEKLDVRKMKNVLELEVEEVFGVKSNKPGSTWKQWNVVTPIGTLAQSTTESPKLFERLSKLEEGNIIWVQITGPFIATPAGSTQAPSGENVPNYAASCHAFKILDWEAGSVVESDNLAKLDKQAQTAVIRSKGSAPEAPSDTAPEKKDEGSF